MQLLERVCVCPCMEGVAAPPMTHTPRAGHKRVATAFNASPVTLAVSPAASGVGCREGANRRQDPPGEAACGVMVSGALYWPDGTPSSRVSSVMVGRGGRRQLVPFHRGLADGGGGEGDVEWGQVSERGLACARGGAACDSTCGWEGVVPVPCDGERDGRVPSGDGVGAEGQRQAREGFDGAGVGGAGAGLEAAAAAGDSRVSVVWIVDRVWFCSYLCARKGEVGGGKGR